ncbi:MAG: HupE/UreJ family protein, partial [Pseudomonadota bacterium]
SGERRFVMPGKETAASVAGQYTWLGAEHIWIGFDHLLFLLCLIWIAGTWKRILITVTGFTIAHSLTLALSALEIVRLPVPPVEAAIALSVLFLAVEVTKGRRDSLTWQHPIAVSSSFGLLHGLGFAAVLGEIGLPQTEVLTGLIFFNVGVELGQVAFALGVVLLLRVATALLGESMQHHARPVMGYAVGCLSAYWLIGRVVAF